MNFETLRDQPRVLIEASLKPVAGARFQPTGFPDLGPAVYDVPSADGKEIIPTLLIESAQSMANRLEAVCWDEATDDLVPELHGLPFVRVKLDGPGDGLGTTSSLQEFHRLNSPYIMDRATMSDGTPFKSRFSAELGLLTTSAKKESKPGNRKATKSTEDDAPEDSDDGGKERDDVAGVINLRKLAAVCFKYDPNSLVHGVFLEKIAGRLRHPRALSAFIEASGIVRADSGGVKFDRVLPKPSVAGVDAKGGYGNVPFHRSEYTARSMTAYFSLDLAQVRGYGLPAEATELLQVLSLWKVRRFLGSTMRLRTACELEIHDGEGQGVIVKRPVGGALPAHSELSARLAELIVACRPHFASPSTTLLAWNRPVGKPA